MAGRIKNKSRHYFYLLTGLAGLLMAFWQVSLYRLTFISLGWLIGGILGLSLIISFLNYYSFRATYSFPPGISFPLAWVWNTISWGFILSSLFLFSNFTWSVGEVNRKEFVIIERASHPGGKGERELLRPTFTISYKGQQKELVFAHRFYKWKDDCQSVILTLQDGIWGFEVIKGKAVTK